MHRQVFGRDLIVKGGRSVKGVKGRQRRQIYLASQLEQTRGSHSNKSVPFALKQLGSAVLQNLRRTRTASLNTIEKKSGGI
jgi:hypothetical protein